MKPILEIDSISKKFNIQHELLPYETLREALLKMITFRKSGSTEEFWALRDVSFKVEPGESIGIIGKNGAGKSTLLKILSKITPPTSGRIFSRGRISSLLEVGTGFHPELTGRENVFLNGSILGMKKREILTKFDEIVDFAGVERFLDTPLKHYSSGMQLRLAFAVAAFLENEILIIDEVLAVGDLEFQRKCMGKMEDVSKNQGRTILLVSHDLNAISTLTTKTLFLQKGMVAEFGKTENVILSYSKADQALSLFQQDIHDAVHPKIRSARVITSMPNGIQRNSEEMKIEIELFFPEVPAATTWFSIHITDSKNRCVLHLWTNSRDCSMGDFPGVNKIICTIPKLRLYMGSYQMNLYLTGPPGSDLYDSASGVCPFEVVMYGIEREYAWMPDATTYIEDCGWQSVKELV